MKSGTIRRFQLPAVFDLMGRDMLSVIERSALDAALEEQKKSTNPKWRVGVAAVAGDGTITAIHNQDIGPTNHAEQLAISEFYKMMPLGRKELKTLVVVGAQFDNEVVRSSQPYADDVQLEDIEPSVWLCGKCLEFIHDCTFNVPDVDIILITITGEVLKTSLRSLFPKPHTSMTVPIQYYYKDGKVVGIFPVPSTEEHKHNASCNGHH